MKGRDYIPCFTLKYSTFTCKKLMNDLLSYIIPLLYWADWLI